MNRKRVLLTQLAALAAIVFVILSCGAPQQIIQTQSSKLEKTAGAEAQKFAQTEAAHIADTAQAKIGTMAIDAQTQIPQMAGTLAVQAQTEVPKVVGTIQIEAQTQVPKALGTLSIEAQTQVPNFLATLSAPGGSAPFKVPSFGYLGLTFKQDLPDNRGQNNGIDIWASKDPLNGGKRGNPVYAAYAGRLGRTTLGLAICHSLLDPLKWSGLPSPLVCTLYDYLTDLTPAYASLKANTCPDGLVEVNQGDLLGYMDQTDMQSNAGVVHLHFVVVQQNVTNGCWTDERVLTNTYDPMAYLGLDASKYSYLSLFP